MPDGRGNPSFVRDLKVNEPRLPGLATLAMVEAVVEREGRTSTIRRYYLSSATLSAERLAQAVRAHWRIESVLQTHTERSSP